MNICVSCGYDLQQLPDEGVCPECGRPIEESLRGPLLENADPHWLSRITLGQTLLSWSLLVSALSALMLLIGIGILFVLAMRLPAGPGKTLNAIIEAVFTGTGSIIVVASIVGAAGALLLTTQEPKEREREPPLSARHLARWGIFAVAGIQLLFAVLGLVVLSPSATRPMVIAQVALTAAAATVTVVALLHYLGGLAKRIPDDNLARRTRKSERTLRWAIPLFALLNLVESSPGARPAAGFTVVQLLWTVAGCTSMVVGIVLIAHASTLVQALFAYRRAFRQCRETGSRPTMISPARTTSAPRP